MSVIVRIIIGLLIVLAGVGMVFKTPTVLSMFGRNYWAEKNFGYGGTRLLYKLLGTGLIFFGILVVLNMWEDLISGVILKLFG